jgi:hypothetical protein
MPSLQVLTERLEVGDTVAWIGERANVGETVYPKTVTKIMRDSDTLRVDGEGVRGGTYYYLVDDAGEGEAFFVSPAQEKPMGPVVFAERTNSTDPVAVKTGYFDRLDR